MDPLGVFGRNLSVGVRVIDHRCEEIYRVDESKVVAETENASIVGRLHADNQIGMMRTGERAENER
jgi:hypothetical protein